MVAEVRGGEGAGALVGGEEGDAEGAGAGARARGPRTHRGVVVSGCVYFDGGLSKDSRLARALSSEREMADQRMDGCEEVVAANADRQHDADKTRRPASATRGMDV